MPGTALSLDERVVIVVGIAANHSVAVIADELDRAVSTVRREIKRNGGRADYSAVKAQQRADEMRRRPKQCRLEADPELAAYVAERLGLRDSPVTISIELRRGVHGRTGSISHECIYRAIYERRGLDRHARQCLHLRRRHRKHRNVNRDKHATHPLGTFLPISERPACAAERVEAGHLEGDLITGTYNRSALITMFDRASRHCWLGQPANKSADAVFDALVALLDTIPLRLRRSLTWDQGSELARHTEISERCKIPIYIADKNSPWQRPTNENGNGLVRRYVGKGTDLNQITPEQLASIQHRINTTPRRIFNWDTAANVYDRLSAPTT